MSGPVQDQPAEFDLLGDSWEMAMAADGYAAGTRNGYRKALASFAAWLAAESPDTGPTDAARDHIRGWLVYLRRERAQNTARTYYAGVRHFYRWLVAEGEIEADPWDGIRSPAPAEPETPVVSPADLRRLLDGCAGRDFRSRRDRAIVMLFVDGGLRLAELAGLGVTDIDVRDRMVCGGQGHR
jgi:site-specific recombinase XerD